MFIKYEEFDLFELFEGDPTFIFDKEVGKMMYVKKDNFGMKLMLNMDVYEQTCSISLSYDNYPKPIIDLIYKSVTRLNKVDDVLQIICANDLRLSIFFKPNFAFQMH